MNKILVLGKYGQLAQALEKIQHDDEILLFSREEIDIVKPETIVDKIKEYSPTHIINTSAYHVITQCEDYPDKAFQINTLAVLDLARICKENNIKLITYSTDYVFDGMKHEPYKEDDKPNPLQVYGISKLAGEYAALNYYPEGTIVIRSNAVFGGTEGSRDKKGNFVLTILNEAKSNKKVTVQADMKISPTYAGDLALATYELLLTNHASGIYHLINEGSCTWKEFAQQILDYTHNNIQVEKISGSKVKYINRPKYSVLANTKAKKNGIILPKWQDGLRRYLTEELQYD